MSNYVRNFGVKKKSLKSGNYSSTYSQYMSGCFFLKHGVDK